MFGIENEPFSSTDSITKFLPLSNANLEWCAAEAVCKQEKWGVDSPGSLVRRPRECLLLTRLSAWYLRLFQYNAIDEFTWLCFLAVYPEQSTYSSTNFLRKLPVVCTPRHPGRVIWRIMALSSPIAFPTANAICLCYLKSQLPSWGRSGISSFVRIPHGTTAK